MKNMLSKSLSLICLIYFSSTLLANDITLGYDAEVRHAWVYDLYQGIPEERSSFANNYVTPPLLLADDPCQLATLVLTCENPRQSTNLGQQQNNFDINTYLSCPVGDFPYSGNDQVYRFTTPLGADWVEFELTGTTFGNLSADLDLFVYSCSLDRCVYASTGSGNQIEFIRINNPTGDYYLIVDAKFQGQVSNYVIWAFCDISDDPCFSNAQTINCGGSISSSTLSSGNNYNRELYRECFPTTLPYTGNDQIYRFNTPQGASSVNFFLENLTNDLDMFIYSCGGGGGCDEQDVKGGLTREVVTINNPSGTYYIIVDGEQANTVGNFTVRVECNGVNNSENPCNNTPVTLACGQPTDGNNFTGGSSYFADVYSDCHNTNFEYDANDRLYRISTPPDAISMSISLTGLGANLDLFLLDCTSSPTCIDKSTVSGTGSESITIDDPAGDYYLIVDGTNGNQTSSYNLLVDCEILDSEDPCTSAAMDLACDQTINTNNNSGGSNFYADLYAGCFTTSNPYNGNDRLFRFTTPSDVTSVTFNLTNLTANLDLFVYDCTGLGTCVDRSTRNGNSVESITINNPFGTYYVIVDARTSNLTGNFRISATCELNNDPCSASPNLISCGQTVNSNNFSSSDNFDNSTYSACLNSGQAYDANDRLYRLTIPTGVSAITANLSGLNANLDLFLVDCSSLATCIAFSTNTGNSDESISADVFPGTYYLIIDGVNANQESAYSLSVNCSASEDPCTTTPILVNCGQTIFGNNLSSQNKFNSDVYAGCGSTASDYSGNDQIYEVTTTPGAGELFVALEGLSANLDLFIYDCEQGTCIASSTNTGIAQESITIPNPNGNYYIIIDGVDGMQLSGYDLTVRCCSDEIIQNCDNLSYQYTGDDLTYSFSADVPNWEQFTFGWEWFVDGDQVGFQDTIDLVYTFPSAGTFEVCYDYLDLNTGCYVGCCNEFCIEDPYFTAGLIGIDTVGNEGYQFRLDLTAAQNTSWIATDSNGDTTHIGAGLQSELVLASTDCPLVQICATYFDPATGCWTTTCLDVSLCPPYDCCSEDPLTLTWLQTFLDCTALSCGREIYCCTYEGQRVIDIKDDPDRCVNGTGSVYTCEGELLFTYGGVLQENLDLAGLLFDSELLFECPDEPTDGCDECTDCFFYNQDAINPNVVNFYNNYCELGDDAGLSFLTYQWVYTNVTTGQVVSPTFLAGTNEFSPHPVVEFATPGSYEACITVFLEETFLRSPQLAEVYSCCQILTVGGTTCFNPPVAHFNFEYEQESGAYFFDASSSQYGDNFTWDIPAAASPTYFLGGQVAYASFPAGDCYDVCLLVNNDCGQSSYCLEICNTASCNEVPDIVPVIQPVVVEQRATFSGIPVGDNWNGFQWSIPTDATFGDGTNANSANAIIDFPGPGRYNVCLTFLNGCQKVCWCWTIYIREVCANVESLADGIPEVTTTTGASNAYSASDYDCYSGNSDYSAPDKIYEIVKPTNEGDLTITLLNDDLNGLPLDLDLFLLDTCALPALCLANSTNPFGQVYLNKNYDAIHLPDYPAGTYYLVVDGYDDQQEGAFRLTATSGNLACDFTPISCGNSITGTTQGAPNNVSAYSCQPADRKGGYTGPELSYRYEATFEGLVNIKLTGLAPDVDLDVMIVETCDQNSTCLGNGLNPAGEDEIINLLVTPGEDYYIIIDGWDGSAGDFVLEVEHPTCEPLNNCDNICTDIPLDDNCNSISYTFVGEADYGYDYSFGGLVYTLNNISGQAVCKWEVDGYEVPNGGQLDELTYTFSPGVHTICLYLEVPGSNCVTQCCKTIYVENPFICGEESISYQYVENQGFQFSLTNADPYQIVSWKREDTGTPLGTGNVSDYLVPRSVCETATISASYYDIINNVWYVCSINVWLCPPAECGETSIDYAFDGMTYVFDFAGSNTIDPTSVIWIEEETGLEFGAGELSQVSYPGALPCETRKICVEYYDYATQSWHLCCRTIFLCDPFACTTISWEYLVTEDAYQFSIPAIEDFTNVSWQIESPIQASFGDGYNSNLLSVADPCPTYVISVRYFDAACNCWRVCSLTFKNCPPEPCCSAEPLTLSWLQPLLDCQQYTCGLQVFCATYQGQAVIHLRDDPYQCSFGFGNVYNCAGDLLFTYGGTSGDNLDLAAQLSNGDLIFECPAPAFEICDDGIDNDGDQLIDCEDPDCSFDIYTVATHADCNANNGTAEVYLDILYSYSGGSFPLTYLWSNGETTSAITGLAPGQYQVTVTNGNGCESIDSVIVGENNNLVIAATADTTLLCEGDSTTIRTIVNGGVPPYSYNWSDNLGTGSTALAKPLATTTYFVTLSDSNACEAVDSVVIQVNPKPLLTITGVDCDASLLTYSVQVTTEIGNDIDASQGLINAGSNGLYTISNVTVGQDVLITVVNPNTSCVNEALVPSPDCPCPMVPAPTSDGDRSICFGDLIPPLTVTALSGLEVNWYDAAVDGLLLAENTTAYIPLGAGTYYAETLDPINNCTSDTRTAVSLTINPLPLVEIIGDTLICAGDSTTLTATGAETYSWNIGDTTASIVVSQGGLYVVEGRDTNGCRRLDSLILVVTDPLVSSFDATPVSCVGEADGEATVNITGGTAPYSYEWENGEDQATRSNLEAGRYFVTVTDLNSCQLIDSVEITSPDSLLLGITSSPPDCSNLANGSISIVPTGGTAPYFYSWSDDPTETSSDRNDLAAGAYIVTVRDFNDCTISDTITLDNAQILSLNFLPEDASCNGASDGQLTAVVQGGTAPYSYLWSDQSTDSVLTNIPANTIFSVEITDALGCTISGESSVAEPSALTLDLSKTDVSCFAGADGTATAIVGGGSPPYTLNWSNQTDQAITTDLLAGIYTLTVTDINDCIIIDSIEVIQPDSIQIEGAITNATSCASTPDGAITLTISGGTPDYTYLWSTGATSKDLLGIGGGTYDVTVTDANDCEALASYTVTEPSSLLVTATIDSVDCNGGTDGSISLAISGGLMPYSILWSDGDTMAVRPNLPAGTYDYTVSDANNCSFNGQAIITEPDALSLQATPTNISCFGDQNGSITTIVSGGTPDYTYLWSNGATTPDLSDLGPGDYSLVITDANDCILQSDVFTITEPDALAIEGDITNATSCASTPDGAITLTISGGTPDYTYLWSTGATSKDLLGIGGGTYDVTVTDANDCEALASYTVTEPSSLLVTATIDSVDCNGGTDGSISLAISGGLTPYSILWSDGDTMAVRPNLPAGTYDYTVSDANNCSFNGQAIITEPDALSLQATPTNISCFGDQNGSITTIVSGGTPDYTYLWSNGATTPDLADLGPGDYSLVITDANVCILQSDVFTITEPDALAIEGDITNATSCASTPDGAITLTISGGTPDYTYLWSTGATSKDLSGIGGGTYDVTVTDANDCEALASFTVTEPSSLAVIATIDSVDCNGGTDGSISLAISGGLTPYSILWSDGDTMAVRPNLPAGTYDYTVSDANNCSFNGQAIITEPDALSLQATPTNISCFGDQNGSITTIVSGGTPDYTYLWSNGATTPDLADLGPGDYSLVITDANDCVLQSDVFTILEPAELAIEGDITNATSCASTPDGAITLTISGGTPDYTYLWSTGATSKDLSGIGGGTYDVTVTDANDCEALASFTVTEPSSLAVIATIDSVDCNGGTDGSISLAISGGLTPYSILWSDGDTMAVRPNLPAGTYDYTVSDANNCSFNGQVIITEPDALSLQVTPTNITCFGDQNGSITTIVSGGTPDYTYLWSNGATTPDLSDLGPGDYSLVITDANDCILQSDVFTITEPDALTIEGDIINATSCASTSDGAITLTITGGTPDYSYLWSTGATSKDLSGIGGGTYDVTVTDANDCEALASFTVTEPSSLAVIATIDSVDCNGGTDGSISLAISGGLTPYSILWSDGDTMAVRPNLPAGTYDYTVSDANNCSFNGQAIITEPDALSLQATPTNITCFGDQNGSITTIVSGGTPDYTYLWSNGATTPDLSDLGPGDYSLVITDANDCILQSDVFTILEPAELAIEGDITNATSCASTPDGAITLTITGGTPDFTYLWSTGATSKDLSGIGGGTYDVTVTDANDCEALASYTVTEPSSLLVTATIDSVDCNGGTDGSISLAISGGLTPYSILWSDGDTMAVRPNLPAGTYDYTVSDANNCSFNGQAIITEPDALSLQATPTNISCFGDQNGSITTIVSGGTPDYTYLWSNGATTPDLADLGPGDYSLVIMDANDCILQSDVFTITEPAELTIEGDITNATSCASTLDGAITLTISGGTPDYSYLWSTGATSKDLSGIGGGTYDVTVTDANACEALASFTVTEPSSLLVTATIDSVDCNGGTDGSISLAISGGLTPYSILWSDGDTMAVRPNLPAGTYDYTVSDANNCSFNGQAIITEPDALTLQATPTNITCFGDQNGSITTILSGGTPDYTYLWSNGATTPDLSDLGPGDYSLVITDANDCVLQSDVFTITEPDALAIEGDITNATSCASTPDGAITLTISGGTPDYSYLWSTGATSKDLSGIGGGTYDVTVTDANACEALASFTVTEPSSLAVIATIDSVDCNGGTDGSISLAISGGLMPYSILWSDGDTMAVRPNLPAGTYDYTVSDANNCSFNGQAIITEPDALSLQATPTNITCFGDQNGSITTIVSGGTPDYTYLWSNGATTPDLADLGPGDYSLVITDANDCILQSDVFTILEPAELTIEGDITNATSCASTPDGAITLTITGGTPDYSYLWSTGATSKDLSGIGGGTYDVTVTDANNCEALASFTVTEPSSLLVTATIDSVDCNGGTDGSISLAISGGLTPYSILWSDGDTMAVRPNLPAGTYDYTVSDANNCSFNGQAIITEPDALALQATPTNITCFGDQNGSITTIVSGGTPDYTYLWSNGATTPDLSDLGPGDYSLVITDANDCILQSDVFTITEPEALVVTPTVTNATSCEAAPDGAISLSVTGGTGSYSYSWSTGENTDNLNGIAGGVYTVTVSDENGCENSQEITVTEPSSISVEVSSTDASCFGGNDGTVSLIVSGGLAPYTVLWADGDTMLNRQNLAADTYEVTVSDANNCSFTTQVIVAEAPILTIEPIISAISCFGEADGTIEVVLDGGTAPYSFAWSNGATTQNVADLVAGEYRVSVTDANDCLYESDLFTLVAPSAIIVESSVVDATPCGAVPDGALSLTISGGAGDYTYLWNTGATTQDINGIGPGIYSVTVSDANNCQAIHERTVNQAAAMEVEAIVTGITCNESADGSINLVISGGIAPYTVLWENQDNSTERTNLAAGTYSYTVSDANNCVITNEVLIEAAEPLTISATVSDESCFGATDGAIIIQVLSGGGGYSFEWSNGSDTPVNNALPAGDYNLILTDQNNCVLDTTFVIGEPSELLINEEQIVDASCDGQPDGSISFNVEGGNAPYTFLWSDDVTASNRTDLAAGTYTLTITDQSECFITSTYNIENLSSISLDATATAALCDENNGTITLLIDGGTTPFSFEWSDDGIGTDVQNPSGLAAGTYSVIITDAVGCSASLTDIAVEGKSTPTVTVLELMPTICGETNGSVAIEITGGEAPFSFSWSNGSTDQNLSNVGEGFYSLVLTDANDCAATIDVTITCFDPCAIAVGSMGEEKLMGCQTQVFEATYDATNEILGDDDIRLFVIHDGSGDMLGSTILNVSTDPIINYTSAMLPNVEYYISAVVGRNNGNGLIDFENSCLAVAPGTPFSYAPAATGPAQLIATNSSLCPGQQLELKVEVQVNGDLSYVWETPKGILTTTFPELIVDNFGVEDEGEYLVSYSIGGCNSEQLGPLVVTLNGETGEVSAGEDLTLCGDGSVTLAGTLPADATGTWYSTSPAFIQDENDPTTFVDSLINGINTFYWLVNTGSCLVRDTVEIYHAVAPTTQDRSITMEANQATLLLNKKALFDAITQTIPDTHLVFSIIQEPDIGDLTVDDEASQLIYQRDLDVDGDQELEFIYEVCNDDPVCGELCSESSITLSIKFLETEIVAYKKGLRPNGKSPIWELTLLRDLDEAKLTIVDRWGKRIHSKEYEAADNLSKGNKLEGWDGKNIAGVSMYTGAYYFIFEGTPLGGGKPVIVKGIVYLLK